MVFKFKRLEVNKDKHLQLISKLFIRIICILLIMVIYLWRNFIEIKIINDNLKNHGRKDRQTKNSTAGRT